MIKGDKLDLFGHKMEVILRKETLDVTDGKSRDMAIYDITCICCTYPRNFVVFQVTDKTLERMIKCSQTETIKEIESI